MVNIEEVPVEAPAPAAEQPKVTQTDMQKNAMLKIREALSNFDGAQKEQHFFFYSTLTKLVEMPSIKELTIQCRHMGAKVLPITNMFGAEVKTDENNANYCDIVEVLGRASASDTKVFVCFPVFISSTKETMISLITFNAPLAEVQANIKKRAEEDLAVEKGLEHFKELATQEKAEGSAVDKEEEQVAEVVDSQ